MRYIYPHGVSPSRCGYRRSENESFIVERSVADFEKQGKPKIRVNNETAQLWAVHSMEKLRWSSSSCLAIQLRTSEADFASSKLCKQAG